MKIIKDYTNNELVFNNTKSKSDIAQVDICGEILTLDYNLLIDTPFSGGNMGQEFENLKNHLNLGVFSKSPCGGFVNFYNLKGSKGNNYILFSGVNEVSNSHYVVTIHKILK